jgi:hypothetical protein
LQRRRLFLLGDRLAALANKLIDGRQDVLQYD